MKRFKGKYAALLGMAITLLSLMALTLMLIFQTEDPHMSVSPATKAYWDSMLLSLLCPIPYAVEGILSIIRANRWPIRRKTRLLDILLAILTLGMIPMALITIGRTDVFWFPYCGLVFAVEVISLIPYFKKIPIYYE